MAKKDDDGDVLRRGERVVAAAAMPGIPEGTRGKVTHVLGFTWVRYWVRFENSVHRGTIDRSKLARPAEWQAVLERRARGEDEPTAAARVGAGANAGDGGGDVAVAAAAGGVAIGGVTVPEHLLERSKSRRSALGK
jgi:hypothetical protein